MTNCSSVVVMALIGCLMLVGTSYGQLQVEPLWEQAAEVTDGSLDLDRDTKPTTGSDQHSRWSWQTTEPDFTPREYTPERGRTTRQLLWMSGHDNSLPDLIEAQINTLLELNDILERYSTYTDENMRIELQLPRPGWSITIPIR